MKQSLWLCFGLAAMVGCSEEGGSTTNPSPSSNPPPPASNPPPPSSGGTTGATTMVQVGPNGSMSFVPSMVSINVGDTVMWDWPAGSLPHTVTSGTPGNADGNFCSLPGGAAPSPSACNSTSYAVSGPSSYSHTFSAAGTFPYFCEIHGAAMTGTVTVNAAPSSGGGGTTGGGGGSGY